MNIIFKNDAAMNSSTEVLLELENARELKMQELKQIERDIVLSRYTFPKKPCKDGYYRMAVEDRTSPKGKKQLFAKSIGELAEKVYQHEREKNKRGKRTFEEVFEELIAERLRRTKNQEKLLSKQNTINKWRQDFKRYYIGTSFISMYVDEITVNHLEDVAEYNLNRYDLNKKAFENMLTIPRMVLRFAFTKYYTNENVYLRLDRKQFSDMVVDTVPIEQRAYSDEELLMILDAVHDYQQKKPDYIVPYALELQILTACRRGEIPPLMWSDVNGDDIIISKEQLTVRKTQECKQHCKIVHHTKNYKNRTFPITDDVEDLLKRLKAVHVKNQLNSLYLFPADTPTGVISNCVVYKFYEKITTRLGIKKYGVVTGPHSFRRNAITNIVNATNGDLELASRLYGNTPNVAKQNYLTGVDRTQALSALNASSIRNRVLI